MISEIAADFNRIPEWAGAGPRIRRGRVPSTVPPAALLVGADARRRDAGDVGVYRRGATTPQMPRAAGTRRAHGCCGRSRRCSTSTMYNTSPPPRALTSPRKPHARDPPEFSDRLPGARALPGPFLESAAGKGYDEFAPAMLVMAILFEPIFYLTGVRVVSR